MALGHAHPNHSDQHLVRPQNPPHFISSHIYTPLVVYILHGPTPTNWSTSGHNLIFPWGMGTREGHVFVYMLLVGEGFPFPSPLRFGLRYFSKTLFSLGEEGQWWPSILTLRGLGVCWALCLYHMHLQVSSEDITFLDARIFMLKQNRLNFNML